MNVDDYCGGVERGRHWHCSSSHFDDTSMHLIPLSRHFLCRSALSSTLRNALVTISNTISLTDCICTAPRSIIWCLCDEDSVGCRHGGGDVTRTPYDGIATGVAHGGGRRRVIYWCDRAETDRIDPFAYNPIRLHIIRSVCL